jgi:hypothetical protein
MHWLFHTHRNMALTILRVMLGVVSSLMVHKKRWDGTAVPALP